MRNLKQMIVITALLSFVGTGAFAPVGVKASEAGRRNTTLGLGALTGVLAVKKMWVPAAIAGVGTYAAYHNWQAKIDARHRRENQLRARHAYRVGYSRGRRVRRRVVYRKAAYHRVVHHKVYHKR
ncbi:MAG TPA: hypothetical protein VFJ58_12680 [Armatimonadota bacterium]|nr:hypothetical protein [Armatimonadota bacterium]